MKFTVDDIRKIQRDNVSDERLNTIISEIEHLIETSAKKGFYEAKYVFSEKDIGIISDIIVANLTNNRFSVYTASSPCNNTLIVTISWR